MVRRDAPTGRNVRAPSGHCSLLGHGVAAIKQEGSCKLCWPFVSTRAGVRARPGQVTPNRGSWPRVASQVCSDNVTENKRAEPLILFGGSALCIA